MHLVLPLDASCDDAGIALQASRLGLGVQALSQHSQETERRRGLLIGFANTRPEQMESGIGRLASLLARTAGHGASGNSAAAA